MLKVTTHRFPTNLMPQACMFSEWGHVHTCSLQRKQLEHLHSKLFSSVHSVKSIYFHLRSVLHSVSAWFFLSPTCYSHTDQAHTVSQISVRFMLNVPEHTTYTDLIWVNANGFSICGHFHYQLTLSPSIISVRIFVFYRKTEFITFFFFYALF